MNAFYFTDTAFRKYIYCLSFDFIHIYCLLFSDEKEELCEDVGVIRLRESIRPLEVPGMVAGTVAVKRQGSWASLCGYFKVNEARVGHGC